MSNIERKQITDSVAFTTIKESRFKTMRISVTAFLPLSAETAADNALMSLVMTRSSEKYPDFTVLSKKLSSLYGASLASGFRKMGDVQALTFSISGIDDRYALSNDVISKELSDLLCDVIFNPFIKDGAFDKNECEQERRQLIDMIDSEFSEKRTYAHAQAIKAMCEGDVYAVSRYGDKDSVNACTVNSLFDAWQNMLKNARFEIIFVGDSDSKTAYEVFKNRFTHDHPTLLCMLVQFLLILSLFLP